MFLIVSACFLLFIQFYRNIFSNFPSFNNQFPSGNEETEYEVMAPSTHSAMKYARKANGKMSNTHNSGDKNSWKTNCSNSATIPATTALMNGNTNIFFKSKR